MNKKLLFATVLFFTISKTTFSQGFQFGLKGGADIQKIAGMQYSDKFAFGYHIGAFAIVSLGSTFAIQPELYYSAVNLDTASGFSTVYQVQDVRRFGYHYLNIPILLDIKANKNFAFQIGPKFGILSSSNLSLLANGTNALKNGDVSAVGGIQLSFSRIKVYGRYQIGLSDVSTLSDATNRDKWTSQSIHVGAALRIL